MATPIRYYVKKTTCNVVQAKVTHKLHDRKKTHRVLSSGKVLPKKAKTYSTMREAKKHLKNICPKK